MPFVFSTPPELPQLARNSQQGLTPQQVLPFTTRRQTDPGPLLVDVRTRRAYHRRHIPGSHNIPLALLVSSEPPEADLVLVGDSDQHTSNAIERLHAQGYPRLIRHLAGGLEAWLAQGLPVEGALNEPLPARMKKLPWISLLTVACILFLLQLLSPGLFPAALVVVLVVVLSPTMVPFLVAGASRRIKRQRVRA